MQNAISNMPNTKIQKFTDLYTWQSGHQLVLQIYEDTNSFPKAEMFGLTNQMRRAAVSITSNIAEGFGRSSEKEKIQFYAIARGSLTELQDQLIIAKDIRYLSDMAFDNLWQQSVTVHKLLNGLITSIRSK